jgi:cytochrome d ubiquinol oxidase subunit I
MTLIMLAVAAPAQLVIGDFHGLNTLEHQPAKVAAMEGAWETREGLPLLLFAIPDEDSETNHFEIGIPKLASMILTHEWDGEVQGLKEWPAAERPPVGIVFWSFRVMVAIGTVMIAVALWGAWLLYRRRLADNRAYLRLLTLMIPLPFLAVLAGWFVTEVGRQPYVLYGVITVQDGLTPSLTGGMALFSLIGYMLVYAVVFTAGIYYLTRIVRAGMPESLDEHDDTQGRPKRPLSAADTPLDSATGS